MTAKVEEQIIPQIVVDILARRGMAPEAMVNFLYPSYEDHMHDPFLMTDMDKAVARIVVAAERDERVVVYGDYDIDGITASAIMIEGLRALGIEARSYIPDRFEEGYGINSGAMEKLHSEGAQLVISVDCGITSVKEAAWAREHGLDLIITDHHAVPAVIPEAVAVVNPKRPGDQYPFKELCGAGVAFKLIQALQQRTGRPAAGQEKWLLDLAALGTVCDVVDLVDENRVLVTYGLKVMRRTRRPGLRALAAVGGVNIAEIGSTQLGFVLGPRMNAAGRLEHASRSLELLMTTDMGRAQEIAAELDELNRQRRASQDTVYKEALAQAEKYENDPVLVLADPGWSHGIVGIVASKLVEACEKPVLVAQVMGESTKGSARSMGTFNMVEALRSQAELFTKFGGHFYAAGYTLPTERLNDLRRGLCEYFVTSGAEAKKVELVGDIAMNDLQAVDWPLLNDLSLLEPFGAANPEPVLAMTDLTVTEAKPIGADGKHLRLGFRDAAGRRLGAVGFGLLPRHSVVTAGKTVSVLGRLNKNEFRGTATLQLVVAELRYE